MKHHSWGLALMAALHAAAAVSQGTPHHQHQSQRPASSTQPAAPSGDSRILAQPVEPTRMPEKGYRSAFEGYRPFRAEEPMKDWRAANEEVRAAGGHVGLMKAGKP